MLLHGEVYNLAQRTRQTDFHIKRRGGRFKIRDEESTHLYWTFKTSYSSL